MLLDGFDGDRAALGGKAVRKTRSDAGKRRKMLYKVKLGGQYVA